MPVQVPAHCDVLRGSAEYVGVWRNKQPAVKEESITDWLLYTISERLPNVTYKAFTRTEEGRVTGADWEWWFVYPQGGFKFRVQAKRLNHAGDNYSSLAYSNDHSLQIEKLIKDAQNLPERALPLYAFYCLPTNPRDSLCGRERNDVGVYLISAQKAYKRHILNGKSKVLADDIVSESVPLQCFICCPLWSGEPTDPFVDRYLGSPRCDGDDDGSTGHGGNNSNSNGDADGILEPESENGRALNFHKVLPRYVMELLESQAGIPEWFESEYRSSLGDVRAIMIHDLRTLDAEEV